MAAVLVSSKMWPDLDALDEIVDADLLSHNQLPGLPPGLAGGKLAHAGFLAAFPDGVTTTEDLIAEGDKVVERVTFSSNCSVARNSIP